MFQIPWNIDEIGLKYSLVSIYIRRSGRQEYLALEYT